MPNPKGVLSSKLKDRDVDVVSFLKTVPKDSLIAGPPDLMDRVVTYCERSAYFNKESIIPLYDNYYATLSGRVRTFFQGLLFG